MRSLLLAFLLPAACAQDISAHVRRKRYLAFPDKSNLAITITLLKPTAFMNGVNTLHEIDFLVPLPRNPHSLIRRSAEEVKYHSTREREMLLGQVEAALDMLGIDGALCLERFICEVRMLKEEAAKSLVLDVLSRLVSLPYSDYDEVENCENGCIFSLFHKNILKGS